MNQRNSVQKNGVPAGSRTPNLLIRSQMLYPIELQVRNKPQLYTTPPGLTIPHLRLFVARHALRHADEARPSGHICK